MMKKHNEGYTLPLVMVVLLVLAIVAVTIMTTSLKNMQRQQGFIETMKAQYAAQGQIEAVVAQLKVTPKENLADTLNSFSEKGTTYIEEASSYKIKVKSSCGEQGEIVTIYCDFTLDVQENGKHKITYTSYEIIKGGAAQ